MKTVTSKTGKEINIRYPTNTDVKAMWEYINTLSKEKTFIRYQGEQISLEEEEKFVRNKLDQIVGKKAVMLLAIHNDTLIANSGIEMHDRIEKHIGLFGISVAKEYRGEGIGKMLMEAVIEEAKKNIPDLEILTLSVFSTNSKACTLYESFGFIQYGILPKGVKYNDRYEDHIYMYKRIK